ncbi:MAG: response regulator [Desulfobacterales bacterium]|nr:response regulator [Desulfobacterales bacterium]
MSRGNILIIDDNGADLQSLFVFLEKEGFTVHVEFDGESGIAAAKRLPPHIILLDVMMPGIDGFETCRRLKAERTTRDAPVIFMTALTDTGDEVKGLKAGAVDYITKPPQFEVVLARVTTHLTNRRLQKELEARNVELEEALANVKMLTGLLPICGRCKKIRDDKGYWSRIEEYLETHSDLMFSHGICPDCMDALYGEQEWYKNRKDRINQVVKKGFHE